MENGSRPHGLHEADRQAIRDIAKVAQKLLTETTRLRGDVLRLHGRIQPFIGEQVVRLDQGEWPVPRNLAAAFATINHARQNIENCERELSAIRGHMDGIASDAISREEMKPWLRSTEDRRR